MKKVLVVGPWAGTGGVHTFMRNLCIHSNLKERWKFKQFDLSRPPKKTIDNNAYNFLSSDPKRLIKSLLVTGGHLAQFPLEVRKADIVQIQASDHYAFWEPLLYAQVAKALGKPVTVRFGGSFDKFYGESTPTQQKMIEKALQIPDGLIVLSAWWKEHFAQYVDGSKIHVIPNAVPKPPQPVDRNSRTGKPTVLWIAGFEAKRKGIEVMLNLVERLHHKANFLFIAVTDQVREVIANRGLTEHIEMHGVQKRHTLKEVFYPRADIFMLPSFGEGFPNSMLEAMAAGLPSLSTPVGAIPEVLVPDIHGYINEPTDADGFFRDLSVLLDNPEKRRQLGENSYNLVCSQYHLDTVFQRYTDLWQQSILTHA